MASRRLWVGAIFLFVLGDALTLQTRGALLASFRSSFGVSEGLLGLVGPAGTVGFVAAVLAVGFVAGRIDLKRGLVVGAGVTAICLLLMSAAPFYWMFLLFMVGQGTATGVVRGIDRPILSHLYPTQRGRMFTLHALAWALGAVSGPLLVNTVLAVTDWRITYAVLGLFFLPITVLLWCLDLPGDVRDERQPSLASLSRLLHRPAILGMAVAMILVGGIEGIVFTWLPYYGTEFVTRERSNLLLSAYLLAYVPGRLLYSSIADRIGYLSILLVLCTGALLSFGMLFSGVGGWVLFASAFVSGFFVSGFFPLISAYGVDAAPEYSGPVSAIATAGTYGGIAVAPVAIGLLAERIGIVAAMAIPVGLTGALLIVLAVTKVAAGR